MAKLVAGCLKLFKVIIVGAVVSIFVAFVVIVVVVNGVSLLFSKIIAYLSIWIDCNPLGCDSPLIFTENSD